MVKLDTTQPITEEKTEQFTEVNSNENPVNNSENIQKTDSKNSINELFETFTQPTQKDEMFSNETTGETGNLPSDEADKATGNAVNPESNKTTPVAPSEPRKKASLMFIKFIDFVIELIVSFFVAEAAEQFKTTDSDLKELAEALYDYELATGKKAIASPLVSLLLTFGTIYGMKANDIRIYYQEQKKINPKQPNTATNEFKAQPETPVKKKDGRGGARPGAGAKKKAA